MDIYRAFYRGKCYEISINESLHLMADSEPGINESKLKQAQAVHDELMHVLDSFRFLN